MDEWVSRDHTNPNAKAHDHTMAQGSEFAAFDVGRVLTRWPSIDARHLVGCGCVANSLDASSKTAHVNSLATAPLRLGMRHENAIVLRILNVDISRT